ncbi:acyl-CoA dehydrogenase family protein [Nocardioides sp. W7]|uniref:acyl-CoA dehydrogenase family protein n=1 Tax=Nocardioides sp. W7 TaxID=2931390 RepID=UPI001FD5A7B1|nr:acyl-CoA dehydrogenase family protein [Nocardioides sp. W7]
MYENRSGSQRSDHDARKAQQEAVRDFATSVAGTLGSAGAGLWPDAVAAPTGDLLKLHEAAAEQGWFELGSESALDFLVAASRELGKRACPLPLADAYVAIQVLPEELAARVGEGELRVVLSEVAPDGAGGLGPLEGAQHATHVLVLDRASGRGELRPVASAAYEDGLAVPAWVRISTGDAVAQVEVEPARLRVLLDAQRLAVAARAVAAGARMHELAVAHTVVRRQFGKPIGAFGAVQQRTAATEIDVMAATALVDQAVQVALAEAADADTGHVAGLAVDLAVRLVVDTATGIGFGAQHTLGAIGFFEEHEASWLFRRVHADKLLLARGARDAVARALVHEGRSLPRLDLGERAESFREEVHAQLARHTTDGVTDPEGLRAEMSRLGWFALGWPEADGGLGASTEEQVVLHEELKYAGGPVDRAMSATMLLGHSLLRHGTPEQKEAFLPLIREGRMAFCLGYSEPEAGSDLASLRTKAVRDGDEWVIDGQKSWTTRAQTASHVWLAVRTDPDATPRHAGITIFLVPMDTPGIEVQPHVALSGEISCTVFYDGVRVPDSARVGEVDGGWKVITDALAAERVVMGGVAATMRRNLDALLTVLRRAPHEVADADLARLSSLAARLQAARVLVVRATRAMEGAEARTVGPVAAVLSGELAEELAEASIELLGPAGALAPGTPDSPQAAGAVSFDAALRVAPMYVIGGGTNDIQRGIIARALGLPRE